MKITSIEKTKKGRYSIFADGEFVFSVSADQIISDKIHIGKEVDTDDLREILSNSQRMYAKQKALNLLSARSYTRKGLGDKLLQVADEGVVTEILDYFESIGYINDEDYAVRKANDLYNLKKYGKSRVISALIAKGINKELAISVAEKRQPEDIGEKLYSVLERKYSRVFEDIEDRQDYYKKRMKVQGALVRMGYGYDDINSAIQRFLDENEIDF